MSVGFSRDVRDRGWVGGWDWGRGAGLEINVGDVGYSLATQALVSHSKEFESYSKCKRKSSEHFEEVGDLIYVVKRLF